MLITKHVEFIPNEDRVVVLPFHFRLRKFIPSIVLDVINLNFVRVCCLESFLTASDNKETLGGAMAANIVAHPRVLHRRPAFALEIFIS